MNCFAEKLEKMFTHIVLTAPCEETAAVYQTQLDHLQFVKKIPLLTGSKLFCFADPAGLRIGSGGGTLHAMLSLLHNGSTIDQLPSDSKVLIVHSGGDARRSPMYSVCGKAWMTLHGSIDSDNSTTALLLLLKELQPLALQCPPGSLVVACSDVLLTLNLNQNFSTTLNASLTDDCVYIVTVPAVVSTAVNHGVLHSESIRQSYTQRHESHELTETKQLSVCLADLYLQKPTVATMEATGVVLSSAPGSEKKALIDTGLVIFTGATLQALLSLQYSSIVSKGDHISPLQYNYLRFELYNELLLACRTTANSASTFTEYLLAIGSGPEEYLALRQREALLYLWSKFHVYDLQIMHVYEGGFLHLGTSQEVFDLLLTPPIPAHLESGSSAFSNVDLSAEFFSPFVNSLVASDSPHDTPPQLKDSFVEHCAVHLQGHGHLINCFISHIVHSDLLEEVQHIGGANAQGWILQEVPIKGPADASPVNNQDPADFSSGTYCLLSLHIRDNTKIHYLSESATICGMSWPAFFKAMSCTVADVWPLELPDMERTLWTAKLFPLCHFNIDRHNETPSASLIACLLNQGVRADQWRASDRLSLADLLRLGDAEGMFAWRTLLEVQRKLKVHASRTLSPAGAQDASFVPLLTKEFERWRNARHNFPQIKQSTTAAIILFVTLLERVLDPSQLADSSRMETKLSKVYGALSSHTTERLFAFLKTYYFATASTQPHEDEQDWGIVLRVGFLRSMLTYDRLALETVQNVLQILYEDELPLAPRTVPRLLLAISSVLNSITVRCPSLSDHVNWDGSTANGSAQFAFSNVTAKALLHSIAVISKALSTHAQSDSVSQNDEYSIDIGTFFEELAQQVTQKQIELSLQQFALEQPSQSFAAAPNRPDPSVPSGRRVVVSRAPVRIDLAGGWSDTPPICYDQGGAVLNVAVQVDGQCPLRCVATFLYSGEGHVGVDSGGGLLLQCYKRADPSSLELEVFAEERCDSWDAVRKVAHSDSACALPKACALLIFQRWLSDARIDPAMRAVEFLPFLTALCAIGVSPAKPVANGISIMCLSDLPAGSGMGGSSILAAVILEAMNTLLFPNAKLSHEALAYMVTQVEQLMTTGGGWQDQIGGIYPGIKLGCSTQGLPLKIGVQLVEVSAAVISELEDRSLLIYTGQQV